MLASSGSSSSLIVHDVRQSAVDREAAGLFFDLWFRKQFRVEKPRPEQAEKRNEAKP